jgi:molybdate transport system regulatory protein
MQPIVQMRIRIFHGGEAALGLGRAELLARIGETQSIAQAARDMGMSYMKAWKLIQSMNRCFKEPAVEVQRGGKGGGTARLSATGASALELYRRMEGESLAVTQPLAQQMARLFRPGSSANAAAADLPPLRRRTKKSAT